MCKFEFMIYLIFHGNFTILVIITQYIDYPFYCLNVRKNNCFAISVKTLREVINNHPYVRHKSLNTLQIGGS